MSRLPSDWDSRTQAEGRVPGGLAAISDEIGRVLARHERYANQLEGADRADER